MRSNIVFILLALILACTNSKRLEGFDHQTWETDVMGCSGQRLSLIDDLMDRRNELTGLGQEEIKAILGKPDRHELHSRNKKAFVYYLADGPDCQSGQENPPKLVIRFDGLGRSKEIIHYKSD